MFKMIAVYKQPADVNAFNDWYKGHTELVKKVPHVVEVRNNKISGGPRGASDIYMIVEVLFNNKEEFKTAMSSPENMACGKDAFSNYKDIVSVHFAEEETLKF